MRFNKLLYQALFPILRAWSQVIDAVEPKFLAPSPAC
jgi:hypothetical protein